MIHKDWVDYSHHFSNQNIKAIFSYKSFNADGLEGRKDLAHQTGFNSDSLIIPKQTHSTNILFSMEAGRVYFVHQLDPVFGLVHAGWRGLVNGILLQSAKQIEEKGISLSNFDILIGPSIQKCCFEVSDDVINQFDSNFIEKKWAGKYRIDLQKLALHQLVQNGFKRERITTLTECTYCDAEKYHSYRRNGKKAGRMIGLLGYC